MEAGDGPESPPDPKGGGPAKRTPLRQRALRSPTGGALELARDGDAREVSVPGAGQTTRQQARAALLAESTRELVQNFVSVFGLALFIFLYTLLFLGKNLLDVSLVFYLGLTVVGLTIFAMGLRLGLMPLGELVGARLPKKVSRPVVFASIFVLGILCTIAEPAIGSLKEAGKNTNPQKAPLLYAVLSRPFVLMVMVGVGVGFAAVFGCLRLVMDQKLKPCLFLTCIPTLATTAMCAVGLGGSFTTVTGLAWDCGAVTTGPVTVPIVLALGIGVAASSKVPAAVQASEDARVAIRRNSLLGTLDPVDHEDSQVEDQEADLSGFGIVTFASLFPVMSVWPLSFALGGAGMKPPAADGAVQPTASAAADQFFLWMYRRLEQEAAAPPSDAGASVDVLGALEQTSRAVVPLVGFLLLLQLGLVRETLPNPRVMAQGLCFCYVGMLVFTLGLDGALVPLGMCAGKALPNAISKFGEIIGPLVILLFGFLAGALATFAEPALAALGETVEKLTKGGFKKYTLVGAVALGVGSGIAVGMAKVYFELRLWIILALGYSVCLALTAISDEAVACIAWDSAGVTTGPVTVPIVLASGLSLGKEVQAAEGFGILSCASIGPIMAVLVVGLLKGREGPRGGAAATTAAPQEAEMVSVKRSANVAAVAGATGDSGVLAA